MDKQIEHWIIVLERIKTEIMWTPPDQFPSMDRLDGLIKEMKQVREEVERKV